MAKAETTNPMDWENAEWDTVEGEFGEISNPEDGPVTGTYVGVRNIDVEDDQVDGGIRSQTIHDFTAPDTGDKFSVWGSTDLDSKLKEVPGGTLTRITFLEKEAIKGGKRQFKRYRVQTAK